MQTKASTVSHVDAVVVKVVRCGGWYVAKVTERRSRFLLLHHKGHGVVFSGVSVHVCRCVKCTDPVSINRRTENFYPPKPTKNFILGKNLSTMQRILVLKGII